MRQTQADPQLRDIFFTSELAITEAVVDHFSDIKRLRNFHLNEKTEPEKVVAYTAYWIWRRKPLQLTKEPSDELLSKYHFLKHFNESFATALLISMVFDTRQIIWHDGWQRYRRFSYLLNYFLCCRSVNPQALELVLYALSVNPIYERIC